MKAFFKSFDRQGDQSYAMSREEMRAGVQQMADEVGYFYSEFNFYWQFFDVDNDGCVTLPEI
jgi:hypothetical protein